MKNRRAYLKSLGAGVGLALAAGCVEQDAGSDDGGRTPSADSGPTALSEPPDPVYSALRDLEVPNYDGGLTSELDAETVKISVGAGETGLVFDPPVIQVAPGTEVVWEWTGKDGVHNVVATDVDSGDPRQSEPDSLSQTLETTGAHRYYCTPHRAIGMHGAIVVE